MMNSHNQLQTTFLNDFSKSIKLLRSHVEGGIFTNEINVSKIASKKHMQYTPLYKTILSVSVEIFDKLGLVNGQLICE